MDANAPREATSSMLGWESTARSNGSSSSCCQRTSRPSGSECSRGSSRTPSMTEKMAVFAPIPRANVRIATAAKPGRRSRLRNANRMSCTTSSRAWALSRSAERTWRRGDPSRALDGRNRSRTPAEAVDVTARTVVRNTAQVPLPWASARCSMKSDSMAGPKRWRNASGKHRRASLKSLAANGWGDGSSER